MVDAMLNPALRQLAEQYLGRPLQAPEAQQLMGFQHSLQQQPAAPSGAIQQARQQAQQTIAQGQNRAGASVRDILASIQASSSQALQVQEAEEQAILKLLEGTQSLAELRPSSLQPGMSSLQAGSQLALSQIAEHLSNLARQEVEKCFQQYFGPLSEQLQTVVQRLQAQDAAAPVPPDAAASPSAAEPATPASSTPVVSNVEALPAASIPPATGTAAANAVHSEPPPPSMQ